MPLLLPLPAVAVGFATVASVVGLVEVTGAEVALIVVAGFVEDAAAGFVEVAAAGALVVVGAGELPLLAPFQSAGPGIG